MTDISNDQMTAIASTASVRAARPAQHWMLLAVLILCTPTVGAAQGPGSEWAITGGLLIDGTGAAVVPGAVITGRGEHITCAGLPQACAVPATAAVIDATGKWIIPGLIDTHVHLDWTRPDNARSAQLVRFALGITTTREAGTVGVLSQNLAHRSVASAPSSAEPRLVVSALASDEHMERFKTRDPAALVRALVNSGADAIKVKREFTAAEWRALVGTAHELGVPVWGHTWTEERSRLGEALAAGIDGVNRHDAFADFDRLDDSDAAPGAEDSEFWVRWQERWHPVTGPRFAETTRALVGQSIWFEPLLSTEKHFTLPYPYPPDHEYLGRDAGVPSLRELVVPWWPSDGAAAENDCRGRVTRVYTRMCGFVGALAAQGVAFVTGTDRGPVGFALSEEVGLLTECGVTPMAALRAATGQAAVALRRSDIGTLERGKLADLVLLDADPLTAAANLRRIWRVIKGGQAYDPATLLESRRTDYTAQYRQSALRMLVKLVGLTVVVGAAAPFIWRLRITR